MTRPQNHRRPPVTLVALLVFGVSAIGVASPAQGQEPLSGAEDEGLIDLYSQPSELGPQEAIRGKGTRGAR
jgi:hypothetical protein